MKKFLSILIIATIAIVAGCRKDDNPRLPDGIKSVPIPLLKKDPASTLLIQDAADFTSKFSVQLYFPNGIKPKKIDIMVAMHKSASNKIYSAANVKLLKADVTAYPTDITVTGPELAQLFGITTVDIVPGNVFEIRANVTLNDGTVLQGFPETVAIRNAAGDTIKLVTLAPYGTDANTFPGSNPTITYKAVCPLNLDDFVGTFTMEDPDFKEGTYPVRLERDGTNRLKLTGFAAGDASPEAVFYLTVNTIEQTISIEKQKYTDLLFGLYHNAYVEGSGAVDACNIGMTLSLDNSVDEGSFSTVEVTIHK